MTSNQKLILKLVRTSCAHMTAENIYEAARREAPGIGLATVYRNLGILSQRGVIRRICVSGEADRFDKTVTDHQHAVCRNCGRMRDVDVGDIRGLLTARMDSEDFTYELCIHDLCESCRRANN